ncbi:MAG: TRL-like family protein [Spirochaetia bacterium]|nr:TRL-like family protein [Spirochaetia bacterium]
MKKILLLALLTASVFALAQCAGGYVAPNGSLFQNTSMNKDVSTKTDVGAKSGKACATGYVGAVSMGDASVKAAAAAGGVTTINSVDYTTENILGSVVAKTCTVVNGN